MKRGLSVAFCVLSVVLFAGCSLFSKKAQVDQNSKKGVVQTSSQPSFHNTGSLMTGPERKYEEVVEKEKPASILSEKSGSLWVMEGQGGYLFSKNPIYEVGDMVSVQLEGEAKEEIESKVRVVRKLLKRWDLQRIQQERRLASVPSKDESVVLGGVDSKQASQSDPGRSYEREIPFRFQSIPCKITGRMGAGKYRVEGSRSFMIGEREYKVIVSGVLKSEDFSERGVSAENLLDAVFDVVSSRKKRKL